MTWLTWKQYRGAALSMAIALILYALCVIFAGNHPEGVRTFYAIPTFSRMLTMLWPFLAGLLIATFVGAPLLAHEREQKTHYLTWTQGISRTRWLLVKLGLMLAAVVVLGGLCSMIASKHFDMPSGPHYGVFMPFSSVEIRSLWARFMTTGPVAIAIVVFALLLGVAVGCFVKRSIPAMALTFVLFLVCIVGLYNIFPYLIPPRTLTVDFTNPSSTWIASTDLYIRQFYVDERGQELHNVSISCMSVISQGERVMNCDNNNIQEKIVYQPAENFVPLQWLTSGLLFALSFVLAVVIFARMRFAIE